MKTLIQHQKTGLYLASAMDWSAERQAALAFTNSIGVLDYCIHHNLREVVLVLAFADPRMDIHLHPFPRDDTPAAP